MVLTVSPVSSIAYISFLTAASGTSPCPSSLYLGPEVCTFRLSAPFSRRFKRNHPSSNRVHHHLGILPAQAWAKCFCRSHQKSRSRSLHLAAGHKRYNHGPHHLQDSASPIPGSRGGQPGNHLCVPQGGCEHDRIWGPIPESAVDHCRPLREELQRTGYR